MDEFIAILKVLGVGLLFGAGLPILFAVGLRSFTAGSAGVDADGTTGADNPGLRALGVALFLLTAAIVVIAVLFIARKTTEHYTGVDLFEPFLGKAK